jgi:aryl-alcohol dehydrogenase-like predicted oxidoreductase
VFLGSSGLEVSPMFFGTALTIGTESDSQDFSNQMIQKLWQLGVNTFDVANNYGNGRAEELLGKSLAHLPRNQIVVCSKGSWPLGPGFNNSGLGRKHIFDALEKSLFRLELDYLDVYYAHRYDPNVSMRHIVSTFNQLINSGKIRYWGVSEWPLAALQECLDVCERFGMEMPICQQNVFSLLRHPSLYDGVLDFSLKNNMGFIGYSPLAQGLLTGKYQGGITLDSRIGKSKQLNYFKTADMLKEKNSELDKFANLVQEFGLDFVGVALNWVKRQQVIPVFGASRVSQIEENLESFSIDIPNEFWEKLESLDLITP